MGTIGDQKKEISEKVKEVKSQKKYSFRAKLAYQFDELFSKGAGMQLVMLVFIVAIIIFICGAIVNLVVDGSSWLLGSWESLMHILDQGTLGNDSTNDTGYLVVMFIATLFGLLLMGAITGIMTKAVETRMDNIKHGQTNVVEAGHTLIIGFDSNIFCILMEILASNENQTNTQCVVVLGDMDVDDMRREVSEHIDLHAGLHKYKTKIVFRRGNAVNIQTLKMVAADKAKSIIINNAEDFETIRVILALSEFLKLEEFFAEKGTNKIKIPTIVTFMHNEENIAAANSAANMKVEYRKRGNAYLSKVYDLHGNLIPEYKSKKVRIMFFENILAHIFAQACKQPGLSSIIEELLDYKEAEVYIENVGKKNSVGKIIGQSYGMISAEMSSSIPIGFQTKDGEIELNPPITRVMEEGEKIVHVAMDDNEMEFGQPIPPVGSESVATEYHKEKGIYSFVILGWSKSIPHILQNINEFALKGSKCTIFIDRNGDYENSNDKAEIMKMKKQLKNLEFSIELIDLYNWDELHFRLEERLKDMTNILLTCPDDYDPKESDRKTTLLLLNVRMLLEKHKEELKKEERIISVTSEMNLVEDQKLLRLDVINDFIVGSEIANRMMVQVSQDPDMYKVFSQLLSEDGAEIYLRYIEDYVNINEPFNWQYLAEKTLSRNDGGHETAIGWIKRDKDFKISEIVLNPKGKHQSNKLPTNLMFEPNFFSSKDRLVVIADNSQGVGE